MTEKSDIQAKIDHHAERLAHWRAKLKEIEDPPFEMEIEGPNGVIRMIFDDGEGDPSLK